MLRSIALCVLVSLAGCDVETPSTIVAPTAVSDIAPDEHLVLFRTSAWLDEETQEWHLPIHGWIYEPQDSTVRRTVFETVLDEKFELQVDDESEANFSKRLNLIIADNERGKKIVIELAGRTFELPESAENGHFEAVLTLSAANVAKIAKKERLPYFAVTSGADDREFRGEIELIPPLGLSIISDIDDTAKISNVTDHKLLLEYTFLLDFVEAPGMMERYVQWSEQGASFHFVSSSPWQLYTPLEEFLDAAGFPWATFSLKAVRFRDETLFDLFKKGTETKPAAIKAILARYPGRSFILVGDSGEQDPEVYAALMREFPQQIVETYIRNVTQASPDDARFTEVFDGIEGNRWHLFEDPGPADAQNAE